MLYSIWSNGTCPGPSTMTCTPCRQARSVTNEKIASFRADELQTVLQRAQAPWVIDWSPLRTLDQKAARALLGMFTLWGDQPVELRFIGAHALRDCLRDTTPAGRRDVEQLWWELRMAALRVMNRADEFELTALDFCVTYEVSPPGWERPRCRFQQVQGEAGSPDVDQSVLGDTAVQQSLMKDKHLRLLLRPMVKGESVAPVVSAVWFNRTQTLPQLAFLAFRLVSDRFRDEARIQLIIEAIDDPLQ